MADRYKMLDRMIAIDESAALQSCSWGLGQVMGAHWEKLGYSSPVALADEAQDSVSGQVRLMGRFVDVFGLKPALKRRDWAKFARGYNGAGYAANKYDTKMADAFARFMYGGDKKSVEVLKGDDIIERGDRGPGVVLLQKRLSELGYYKGQTDGIFGGGTETAVMDFQRSANLQVDGRVGPNTRAKLAKSSASTASAKAIGAADVVYKNQSAIRNRPCTAYLETTLATAVSAVYGPGYQAQIYSGGQARKGTPGERTGSIRHDDYGSGGRALDAWIVNKSGKRLSGVELGKLGQYWLAMKHGGCGLEMAGGGIHLDEWTKPPPGGGMFWTYAYLDAQPWAAAVRKMLVDGSNGIKP